MAREPTVARTTVDRYDGQSIFGQSTCGRNTTLYDLGSYLGGGAAGVYVLLLLRITPRGAFSRAHIVA